MNIYTTDERHVGKRYAAGIWCWDCRIRAEHDAFGLFFFCPRCGQRCAERTLSFRPVYRESGLDNTPPHPHSGVDGASGFIWCTSPEFGLGDSSTVVRASLALEPYLVTECGDRWTLADFTAMFLDVIEEQESDVNFT